MMFFNYAMAQNDLSRARVIASESFIFILSSKIVVMERLFSLICCNNIL